MVKQLLSLFYTNKSNVLHNGEKNSNCDYFISVGEGVYKLRNSQIEKDLRVVLIEF